MKKLEKQKEMNKKKKEKDNFEDVDLFFDSERFPFVILVLFSSQI